MKYLFIFPLAIMILSSCSKIQERRLTSSWVLSRWEVTPAGGSPTDGIELFSDRIQDEVRIEFLDDGRVLLQDYQLQEIVAEEEGRYETDAEFDHITFTDSIWMFNQGVTYDLEQLKRGELVISGSLTLGNETFDNSTLSFTVR